MDNVYTRALRWRGQTPRELRDERWIPGAIVCMMCQALLVSAIGQDRALNCVLCEKKKTSARCCIAQTHCTEEEKFRGSNSLTIAPSVQLIRTSSGDTVKDSHSITSKSYYTKNIDRKIIVLFIFLMKTWIELDWFELKLSNPESEGKSRPSTSV